MKTKLFSGLFILVALVTQAQKGGFADGTTYMPVKDNWGVSLGVNGLSTLGFNNGTAPTSSLLTRYYFKDCAAYRFGLMPRFSRSFSTSDIGEDQRQEMTTVNKSLGFSLGYQNNFQSTPRLNPYAGLDVGASFARLNNNERIFTIDTDGNEQTNEPWSEDDLIGAKSRTLFAAPFIGFEYYVAPKLALGAEANYHLDFTHIGPSKSTYTFSDGSTETTTESESQPANSTFFGSTAEAQFTLSYYFWKTCCDKVMGSDAP